MEEPIPTTEGFSDNVLCSSSFLRWRQTMAQRSGPSVRSGHAGLWTCVASAHSSTSDGLLGEVRLVRAHMSRPPLH